ncbi:MAG: hypothetical protein ACRELB_05480 [Polyangiaceae bacterium]
MTNARALLGWNAGYHTVCREERNVVAMLYHLLMDGENLARFLDLAGCKLPVVPEEVGVYFEYAFLRDLWNDRVRDNAQLGRKVILDLLQPSNPQDLERMSVEDFNGFFGAVPRPSRDFIQSPGNWSIERFAPNVPDRDQFLRICRFKWAFNAKPDLVVHVSHDGALCVEAKFASGEGHYPSKGSEKAEFARRGLPLQAQTDLQTYILRDLLGLQAEFVFLVEDASATSASHRTLVWREVFAALDTSSCQAFMREWITRFG